MNDNQITIQTGWREWVSLPGLGIPAIKTKIDTGARTSALHTFNIETSTRNGSEYVRFLLHPLQKRTDIVIACEARVLDKREVRDSGGHVEERYVIETTFGLQDKIWPLEISLTSRDDMMFRMLLGRTALVEAGLSVDPSGSYLASRRPRNLISQLKEIGQ